LWGCTVVFYQGSSSKTEVITPFDTPPPTPQQGLQTCNENNTLTILDNSLIPYLKNYSDDDNYDSYALFGPSLGHTASTSLERTGDALSSFDNDLADAGVLGDDEIFLEIGSTFDSFDPIVSPSSPPSSSLPSPRNDYHHLSTDFVLFE
jgi:hypothetical protein